MAEEEEEEEEGGRPEPGLSFTELFGVNLFAFWDESKIASFADLRKQGTLVGASFVGADEYMFPELMNGIFGRR